jgi:hypothetical protein
LEKELDSNNYRIKRGFITPSESSQIINWIDSIHHAGNDANHHLSELSKELKGNPYMFDISDTPFTNYITKFQSVSDVSKEKLPDLIHDIVDRIAKQFNLPKDHVFLQAVDMNSGGKINPHYDAAVDGHVNYKCNISVLSEDYELFLDKDVIQINQGDLYGFEASLYKHWTNEFKSRRIFLSFGFILPYDVVGRKETDVRIRLSKRIERYFQKTIETTQNV